MTRQQRRDLDRRARKASARVVISTDRLDVIVFSDERGKSEVLTYPAAGARLASLGLHSLAEDLAQGWRDGRVPCVITLGGHVCVSWLRLAGIAPRAAA